MLEEFLFRGSRQGLPCRSNTRYLKNSSWISVLHTLAQFKEAVDLEIIALSTNIAHQHTFSHKPSMPLGMPFSFQEQMAEAVRNSLTEDNHAITQQEQKLLNRNKRPPKLSL